MSERQNELPEGWVWATVGDLVVNAQSGFACGKKGVEGGIRHLRMNNIGPDCRLDLSKVTKVPSGLAKERHVLKPGDVLFCHTNSQKLVGKTALFDAEDGPYAYSNHLTRLRLPREGSPPQWLWYSLALFWRDRYFETRCKQWVNQATVERETLLSTPIPVAPLPEQRRIIAKIEAMFEQSRTARQALDRIPPLLKKFRQSVLAAAFRGDLTRDWREQNPDVEPASALLERIRAERRRKREEDLRAKGKDPRKVKFEEPKPVDTSDLSGLPGGWVWCRVEEFAEVKGGIQKTPARRPFKNTCPYLRVANVLRGQLDLSEIHHFELFEGELEKWCLLPGDVLVVEGNGSLSEIGRCALWRGEIPECVHQNHIIRVRCYSGTDPSYFHWFLNSAQGCDIVARVASSTSGLYTLSVSKVQRVVVPLAPSLEQQQIISRIEMLLAFADAIEAAVRAAGRRADQLDQSILSRAFHGELVPQDPNDEPACALLERISRQTSA